MDWKYVQLKSLCVDALFIFIHPEKLELKIE